MSDIDNLVRAIDPAPHAPDQGPGARELRESIMATQAGRHRTARRLPWRACALGLAAAAAATAVFLGQVAPTAAPYPVATPGGTTLSGTSILLAAAAKAEAASEGAYWHLKRLYAGSRPGPYGKNGDTYYLETSNLSETWVAKDGRTWIGHRQLAARPMDPEAWRRDGSPAEWPMGPDGGVYSTSPGESTFFQNKRKQRLYWSAMPMTLKEIEALPADPEVLKKRAAEAIRSDQDFAGSVEEGLPRTLASLLYELPASPQVRGAAYRALATLPAVRVEGQSTDPQGRSGVAVTFPIQGDRTPQIRLIIDPDTSKVLTFEVTGMPQKGDRVNVVLESGWTDTRPSPPSTG
ncbi:CU044_5270 family protein [Streptosporangium amethystogenes]|uniref:CU044_5270 family protein n=1 Tax=Streptosporangium amethystogenes TaxID=2002 RepID=UPI0004C6AF4E|nr:CU044_5270 family protein [Streptosporangium amethystogenes]